MEIKDLVEITKDELVQLTGFNSPNAIGIIKDEGIWHITIEITEKPSGSPNLDLLGIYEVRVDASGNMLSYERVRMRKRCEKDSC
ncbi:MAG: gas vesicle protein [Bacteroidetes bacterium]|nr:gas vesicle protein [Bacteroidota bacterium]